MCKYCVYSKLHNFEHVILNMSFVNKFLHVNLIFTVTISCKIEVLLPLQ
jgi:hypothetical protein